MISGFQGLPQNPSNHRPTMALLSCSRDITDPLMLWLNAFPPSDEASLSRGSESLISASCALIPRSVEPRQGRRATRGLGQAEQATEPDRPVAVEVPSPRIQRDSHAD